MVQDQCPEIIVLFVVAGGGGSGRGGVVAVVLISMYFQISGYNIQSRQMGFLLCSFGKRQWW